MVTNFPASLLLSCRVVLSKIKVSLSQPLLCRDCVSLRSSIAAQPLRGRQPIGVDTLNTGRRIGGMVPLETLDGWAV